jgi:hypothetical protein
MIKSPMGLATKNNCAVEGQQQQDLEKEAKNIMKEK